MTAIPQPSQTFASERITDPLRRVAQRQWLVLAARCAIQASLVALGLLLAASLLFGFWQSMPVALRVVVAIVVWSVIAAGVVYFARPALRRRRLRHAAYAVEQNLPGVDERISCAVELSEESDPRFAGSPALVRKLIEQAEADAARVDPVAVVPATPLKRWAVALAPVVLLWLVLLPLMPRPLMRGLVFAFAPWRTDAPAALAEITVTPGDARIAQGDAFRVEASVADGSGGDGAQVVRRFATGQTVARALEHPGATTDTAGSAKPQSGGSLAADFENVRESFQYRVEAAGTQSRWFDVTVVPRPSVARLDVAYDFPAYTGIDDRVDTHSAGDVRAIVGTKLTLTVHSTAPVAVGADDKDRASRIVVNKGRRDEQTIALTPAPTEADPNRFTASLFVTNSGTYQIHLLGPERLNDGVELWNRDDQPRSIEARFDQPPTVAITSPKSEETVGADDSVPVSFEASDDFGVAAVEALVQVDDKPVNTLAVNLAGQDDRKRVADEWMLSVPEQILSAGVTEAARITYQFRVTDNRDPDPQSVLSAKQTLVIRKDLRDSIATRLDAERVQKLQLAIDQTVQKLDQSRPQLEQAKNPAAALTADQQKLLHATQQQIAQASQDLAKAAAEQQRSPMAPVVEKAQQIAADPIRQAAENAAKAALKPEANSPSRVEAATEAQKQIDAAKQQLAQLKLDVAQQQAKLETARLIDQAESIQQEVAADHAELAAERREADEKAQEPNQSAAQQQANQKEQQKLAQEQAKLAQRQQESAQRLAAAVQKEAALQNAQAVQDAQVLAQLAQQVTQIQLEQRPLQQQVARQSALNAAKAHAEELARRQEELNKDIVALAQKEQVPLQLAGTQPPARDMLNAIAAMLRQPDVGQANNAQKNVAQHLEENANQLNAAAKQQDPKGPEADRMKQTAAAQQQAAQQAEQQAKQAAQNLQNVEKSTDANAKTAAQKAAAVAAKDLALRAKDAEQQGAAAAKDAEAALERAKESAKEADVAKKAADERVAEAKRAAQIAAGNAKADPEPARRAAAQQQSAKAAQQAAEAARSSAKAQAQAAEKAAKAAATARQAAEEARGNAEEAQKAVESSGKASDVAKKLDKAADQLKRAVEKNADAEQSNLAADQQHAAAEAAERAAELAQKQAALAADTAPAVTEFQQAQQNLLDPSQVAQQQSQLGQRTQQASQAAAQLQQSASTRNPDFADRANAAQRALKDAADAEAAAAEAQTKAVQAQQAMAKANQEAAAATVQKSQADARADQSDAQARAQEDQAANLKRQSDALAKQAEHAKALGNDAQAQPLQQQSAQLAQQSQQIQQSAQPHAVQAAEARKAADTASAQAATAVQQASDAHQQAVAAQRQSALRQAEALEALERAEVALREPMPPEQLASAKSPSDAASHAKPSGSEQGQNKPAGDGGKPSGQQSDERQQAMAQAAQNVQEAAQAQQQAFAQPQGNALASAQAARALRDAAEAMAKAVPESRRGQRAAMARSNGNAREKSDRQARADITDPNAAPAAPGESTDGVRTSEGNGPGNRDDRPQNVKELGISAADWAKLGPLTRQELLNAAQQSGPPAYREAIKNYFVKIARIRSDAEPTPAEVKQ